MYTRASQPEPACLPIDVIIPALDEATTIGSVVAALPHALVRSVVVVDNGSTDHTAAVARAHGARVVSESQRGYGAACLAGVHSLPDGLGIVVFIDGDGSDDPSMVPQLVRPIRSGQADLVVGTRMLGPVSASALMPAQRLGNAIAAAWLRRRFGLCATDLGPFRAIRSSSLTQLAMSDRGYGWTVEMQIKAARAGLNYCEIPVPYRSRTAGRSKISGTVVGTLGAATKILGLLARHDLSTRLPR